MKWSYVPRWKFTDSYGRPRVSGAHCRLAMTAIALWCLGLVVPGGRAVAQPAGLERIQHLIVIYQENWSFDSLYGKFPGADGIANAGERVGQMKKDGTPYTTLPQPLDTSKKPPVPDARFPTNLPVVAYDAAQYVPPNQATGDIVNRPLQEQLQINGGRMDGFVAWSENGGLAMSYYDATDLPVGRLAQQYVLADHFFHSAFGGSLFNHFWLVCACTPVWSNAPANLVLQLDAEGVVIKDGSVTPDGYVVHTVYPSNRPYPASIKDPAQLMPLLTNPTIGDRLSEKEISWAWYSGGWNDAVAGHPDPLFQFHHQPFNYFAPFAEGAAVRAEHLKDIEDLLAALRTGNPPAVAFVKPIGADNEHPGYADLLRGQQYVATLVKAVQDKFRLEGQCDNHHLRRGRWALGSRPAAAGRSLGSRGSCSGHHYLALCETPLRRSHDL